jgi:hypothetical protein
MSMAQIQIVLFLWAAMLLFGAVWASLDKSKLLGLEQGRRLYLVGLIIGALLTAIVLVEDWPFGM